jgi:uncharacterized protein (DUF1810 family)
MNDPFDLARFVGAQTPVYDSVLHELRAGRKRTHWMWFIFPQLHGLGRSAMAERYGIASKAEAAAYLAHGILGARLRECMQLVLAIDDANATRIFGVPDDLKFRSCMTLFDAVAPDDVFAAALTKFYFDSRDALTIELLKTDSA